MHRILIFAQCALVAMWLSGTGGCGTKPTATATGETADHDHPHEHAHEHAGPHNGHVIELGSDTHHAELTHDEETHVVGVYLLDGGAEKLAPIAAESVTINVAIDGTPTQYVLPAVPQPGEADGQSSYFELASEPLCTVVCGKAEGEATARVSITIDGKPFVGIIDTEPHEHDHDHPHPHPH